MGKNSIGLPSILCIGDPVLDRFTSGVVERISPEAPIPVFSKTSERSMAGGAANVACNAAALGARVVFCTALGTDAAGAELAALVEEAPGVELIPVRTPGRRTSVKTRFVAGGQQLLRVDDEVTDPIAPECEAQLLQAALSRLPGADQLLICDYAKGVVGEGLVRTLIDEARALGRPVLIDAKRSDLRHYSGAHVATPNAFELHRATGLPTETDEEVERAGLELIATSGIESLVVTRGVKGLSIVRPSEPARHLGGIVREVLDVSGAGDSVLAALAVAIGTGTGLHDAARLANVAGSIAVGRPGTAIISRVDLAAELRQESAPKGEDKLCDRVTLARRAARWRAGGLRVGFTNGCFDLLHLGHLALLERAKESCDRLIVGLNSDASVRRLKGSGRPANSERTRAAVLAAIGYVDAVTLFDEDTPIELLRTLLPDVLIKGSDYPLDGIVGAELVQERGGEVLRVPIVSGQSTTSTISKLVSVAR